MRDFLQSSLRLHLRLMKQPVFTLLVMVFTALAVSIGVSVLGNALLAREQFSGLKIAVVDQSEQEDALRQLTQFTAKESGGYTVSLVRAATTNEAQELLLQGDVSAVLVLPAGFSGSGSDTGAAAPQLYLDPSRPLDMLLAEMFLESAGRVLAGAEEGIDFVMYVYDESDASVPPRETVHSNIRLEYSFWMLGRATMFRDVQVSPTGSLTVGQFYLLGTIAFFALLATPVLFSIFSFRRQKPWVGRLNAAGGSLRIYGLSKIICGVLAITVMLALFLAGAAWVGNPYGMPTPALLVGLLVNACFLSCVAFLCCNAGSVLSSTILTFLLGSAGLYLSGGLVPAVLLPQAIRRLSPYSPLTWMRDSLAPVFGLAADWGAMLALLGLTVLLFLACMLYCWRLERRWTI